uniref:Kinesinlike protein putative n=1 Tax=Albugo laibachii Nc14 TaxID=890382 RepID=F0WUQ5_9STRA|nr:kinesinlike protein putative [Albugo laibachii Nc14]CCA25772.1 kinesinlike protein putative [Albugo laibachii Nc14]|eukprot:CCA25772.1 kinesinlike protein putative [Albugo laibachii Nc14]
MLASTTGLKIQTGMETNNENVKVFCRIRPPVEPEKCKSAGSSVFSLSSPFSVRKCITVPKAHGVSKTINVHLKSNPQTPKSFTFDRIFHEESSQDEVFQAVGVPLTRSCLAGYNGTIFAYGQTGSGKTFTMQGPEESIWTEGQADTSLRSSPLRGVVPRVFEYLFDEKSLLDSTKTDQPNDTTEMDALEERLEHRFTCSFLEIYNERVFDLLDVRGNSGASNDLGGLQLRENGRRGVFVEGLTESVVENAQEATALMKLGARNRHVGQTLMNRESSRSHSVFILQIQTKQIRQDGITRMRTSRFNLVDLAGSERQRSTEASGDRLKEAGNINKSLSALGNVIMGLVDKSAGKNRHVHYRDSKLTFLLKDSLGGNSKTFMVATVSPAGESAHETLSTLKFAQRAKSIRNEAVINEATTGNVAVLQQEIQRLKSQLQSHQARGKEPCREVDISVDNNMAALSSLVLKTPDDPISIQASSTRLCELESTLAQISDQYIDLQKAYDRLKESKGRTEKLVMCMEQKLSHQRFLLRLTKHSADKGKIVKGLHVPECIDGELNYTPSVDAVQWRIKYEELGEAYVRLSEQCDDQNAASDTLGGSYDHKELIDEFEKLSKLYVSLSCQLSRIISDKQELQNTLRDLRETEGAVECTRESCKQKLEKKLKDQASEFNCRLVQATKLQEIVERKAATTSMDLLQSKQKEMALTTQLFEVQRVCQEAQFCLQEETRSRDTLAELLLAGKNEKTLFKGQIKQLSSLKMEWETRFAKQRVLNQLLHEANERRLIKMALREQNLKEEMQHLKNSLSSASMELKSTASSFESLSKSNSEVLSNLEASQNKMAVLEAKNAYLTEQNEKHESCLRLKQFEHELTETYQTNRIKETEAMIERKTKQIGAIKEKLEKAYDFQSSLRARMYEVECMSKEDNAALRKKYQLLMKYFLSVKKSLESKNEELLEAMNESDARLRQSEAFKLKVQALEHEMEDARSKVASLLLMREEEAARHQQAHELLMAQCRQSQEAEKETKLLNAKLRSGMIRIKNEVAKIRTDFMVERAEIRGKLCDIHRLYEHSGGYLTQTTECLELERRNLENIGSKMSSFDSCVVRVEDAHRKVAGRISQMQAARNAAQKRSAVLNEEYHQAQDKMQEMETSISTLSDDKNQLALEMLSKAAQNQQIIGEKSRIIAEMEGELKESQSRAEKMIRRLIESESNLAESTVSLEKLKLDNTNLTEKNNTLVATHSDMIEKHLTLAKEQRRTGEAHCLALQDVDGHKYRHRQLRAEYSNLQNADIILQKKLHEMEISHLAEAKHLRDKVESLEGAIANHRIQYEHLVGEKEEEVDQLRRQVQDLERKLNGSLQEQRLKDNEFKDRVKELENDVSATKKTCDEQKHHISSLLTKCAAVEKLEEVVGRLEMEKSNLEMKVEESNQKRYELDVSRACVQRLLHTEEHRARLSLEDLVSHRSEIAALNDKVGELNASVNSNMENDGILRGTIEALGSHNERLMQKIEQEQRKSRDSGYHQTIESLRLTIEDLLSRLMRTHTGDVKLDLNEISKMDTDKASVPKLGRQNKQRVGHQHTKKIEVKQDKCKSNSNTVARDASSKEKAVHSLRMENAALLKEKNRWKHEAQSLTNKLKELAKETDQIVSHHNKRQKIQHHIKVKEENNRLQDVIRTLTEDKYRLQCHLQKLQGISGKKGSTQAGSDTNERGKENIPIDDASSRKASSDNSTASSCDSGLEEQVSVRLTKKTKRV